VTEERSVIGGGELNSLRTRSRALARRRRAVAWFRGPADTEGSDAI